MFALLVELELIPGSREWFLTSALANARASERDEPGCLRFDVIADDEDPLRFRFEEHYVDAVAFDAHRASPHYADWRRAADACVRRTVRHSGRVVDRLGSDEPRVIPAGGAARDRGGGVRTVELLATSHIRAGTTVFDAGAGLPMHSHNCEETVRVLSGTIEFATPAQSRRLGAGDTTWAPPGVMHRFHDAGPDGAEIHFVYGGGRVTRTLASSGRTVVVGSEQDGDYPMAASAS